MNYALQGVAVGLPWNALLVATDLYDSQINTKELAEVESLLTVVYLTCNLMGFGYLNRPGYNREGESRLSEALYVRNYYALNLVSFTLLSSSPWFPPAIATDNPFLAVVLMVAGLMGWTSAFCQHALFAFAAREGPRATQSYLLGFALSGAAVSLFAALVTAMSATPKLSGSMVFLLAVFSLALGASSFFCYLESRVNGTEMVLPSLSAADDLVEENSGEADGVVAHAADETKFKALGTSVVVISLSLAGTLFVFPGFVSSLKPSSLDTTEREFTQNLFLQYNLGDAAGRLVAHLISGVPDGSLFVLVLIRTALLSLFGLCNRDLNPIEGALGDQFSTRLVFFQAMAGGMLFAEAAMRAPKAIPSNPGYAGKVVATTIAVSLAVGAVAGNALVQITS